MHIILVVLFYVLPLWSCSFHLQIFKHLFSREDDRRDRDRDRDRYDRDRSDSRNSDFSSSAPNNQAYPTIAKPTMALNPFTGIKLMYEGSAESFVEFYVLEPEA